jgi:hypothetical protein
MADMRFDSVLARKLNTFIALSPDELKCLAEMQSQTLSVRRDKQLTQEGQTGHKAFVLQAGWPAVSKTCRTGGARSSPFRLLAIVSGCAASCCEQPTTPSRR